MNPIFCRTTSSSNFSLVSETSDNQRIINSEEIIFEDFSKKFDNWKVPSISTKDIYKTTISNLFSSDFVIKTEERDLPLANPYETIQLLSPKALQKHRSRNFKYIHIECVQVGIKPLTKEGLNTSLLADRKSVV